MIELCRRIVHWGLVRKPLRTLLLLLTVTGAFTSYVLIDLALSDMATGALSSWRLDAPFDITVTRADADDKLSAIAQLPGVVKVESSVLFDIVVGAEAASVAVIYPHNTITAFHYLEGCAPQSESEVAVTGHVAERQALNIGDQVWVSPISALEQATEYRLTGIIAPQMGSASLNLLTEEGARRLSTELAQYKTLLITLDGKVRLSAAVDAVKALMPSAHLKVFSDQYEGVSGGNSMVEFLMSVSQVLIFAVCSTCLFVLFYLAQRERSYEFGVLRAMGFSQLRLVSILVIEAIVILTVGCTFSLAVILAVGTFFNTTSLDVFLARYFSSTFGLGIVAVLAASLSGYLSMSHPITQLIKDDLGTR